MSGHLDDLGDGGIKREDGGSCHGRQQCTDGACVVRLCAQEAGGGGEHVFVLHQCCCTLVGSHANVLKYKRPCGH